MFHHAPFASHQRFPPTDVSFLSMPNNHSHPLPRKRTASAQAPSLPSEHPWKPKGHPQRLVAMRSWLV